MLAKPGPDDPINVAIRSRFRASALVADYPELYIDEWPKTWTYPRAMLLNISNGRPDVSTGTRIRSCRFDLRHTDLRILGEHHNAIQDLFEGKVFELSRGRVTDAKC